MGKGGNEMKITRILKRYAGLSLGLCLLGAGTAGCIKDDVAAGQNATVTMTFTTQAEGSQAPESGKEAATGDECMKTLRVIVVRQRTQEILFNDKYNIPADQHEKTINYSELTVEKNGEYIDFYAIANEDGFNASTGTPLEGKNINLTALKQCMVSMDVDNATNGIKLTLSGLPQTDFMSVNVGESNDGHSYTMPLQFLMAKARITFLNTTEDVQRVESLCLENVQPANASSHATELFRDTELQTSPVTVAGSTDVNIEDVTIPAAKSEDEPGEAVKTCYFYETVRGNDPYKLTATWKGTPYSIDLDDSAIEAISRGQMLDITVTLKKSAVEVSLVINYEVKEWTPTDIEVPPFN